MRALKRHGQGYVDRKINNALRLQSLLPEVVRCSRLGSDRSFVLQALARCGGVLEHVAPRLQRDREVRSAI